jgi:hypothetical protein
MSERQGHDVDENAQAKEPADELEEMQTFFDDPGGQATTKGADEDRVEKR